MEGKQSKFMNSYILIFIFGLFYSFSLFILMKFRSALSALYPNYNPIQKIHINYTPPFGGLILAIFFYVFICFFYDDSIYLKPSIVFPSASIILISSLEDLKGNLSPIIRFLIIFFCSIIFITNADALPKIDIPYFGEFLKNNRLFEILFFSICVTALANGYNMIDGMNGLLGLSCLSSFFSIFSLFFIYKIEFYIQNEILLISFLLIVFLFFNFPFGKIFFGDAGAYWLGWIMGCTIITIYAENSISTWGALLIIFYPTIEVIFSTIRKILQKKNPLKPDIEHLHLKIYYNLKGPTLRNQQFNSFTTLCLMPVWFTPPLAIIWSYYYSHLVTLILGILVLIYILMYLLIPSKKF